MGGGRERERPARLQHAPGLAEEELDVVHVLDHVRAEDEVEVRVGQWQRRVGLELHQGLGRQPVTRPLERGRGHVGHGQLVRRQLGPEPAVPAAQVECPPGGRQAVDEVDQVPGRCTALGRDERPQLVVVAAHRGPAAIRLLVSGPTRSRTIRASGNRRRSSSASSRRTGSWLAPAAPSRATRRCSAVGRNW